MNKSSYSKHELCIPINPRRSETSRKLDCQHELERIEFQEWDNWQGQQEKQKHIKSEKNKASVKKKKLYGKEWNDEGKLCLCIPPRVLNLVTSTLSPQRYTLKHLSGCTMILTRTDSSTEGNSPKALSVDPASSSERKTVCISTSFTRDKV